MGCESTYSVPTASVPESPLPQKQQSPHHYPIQNYPQAPYIDPGVVIGLMQEELWYGVREGAQLMADIN